MIPGEQQRWVGQSIRRREDGRLLTGQGKFVDDLPFYGLLEAAILRSPFGHARIVSIDAAAALRRPGVQAVLTGRGVAKLARPFGVVSAVPADYYPIAIDKVRYAGEPVGVVVARDRYLAEDALEDVAVEYDPLPAVIDPEVAAGPDAPILHGRAGTNVAIHRDLRYGDPEGAFRDADEVVEARFSFPKYSSTPIETYGVVAQHDAVGGVLTIWSNFHGPFVMHALVARALQLPENRLRFIVAPDIGGSFGIKISSYPYLALIGMAAMQAGGRPVKWIEDRLEHLTASSSGASRISYVGAALRRDGTITGLRYRQYDNVGAYIRATEPGSAFRTLSNQTGAYAVPNLALDAYVVMTNVCPTGPNRG
ncbi:MAG TPA: molybdopterin cofactor-binding domain-containing protein, partial [Dehalococcoidia bacterium]|nr:molybdopterin cofactor-binding domain-containing protein [Dehalococcoidia bacterium]